MGMEMSLIENSVSSGSIENFHQMSGQMAPRIACQFPLFLHFGGWVQLFVPSRLSRFIRHIGELPRENAQHVCRLTEVRPIESCRGEPIGQNSKISRIKLKRLVLFCSWWPESRDAIAMCDAIRIAHFQIAGDRSRYENPICYTRVAIVLPQKECWPAMPKIQMFLDIEPCKMPAVRTLAAVWPAMQLCVDAKSL